MRASQPSPPIQNRTWDFRLIRLLTSVAFVIGTLLGTWLSWISLLYPLFVVFKLAIGVQQVLITNLQRMPESVSLSIPITGRQKASGPIFSQHGHALTLITTQLLTESPRRVISFHHLGCYADASIFPPRYFCKSMSVVIRPPDLSLCPFWARRNSPLSPLNYYEGSSRWFGY